MTANIRFVTPHTVAAPRGYTHAVEAVGPGRLVHISGQFGQMPDGTFAGAPGDFRAQCTQAFENVKQALKAVGGNFSQVVKITNYFVNMDDLPTYFPIRDSYVNTAAPPASTAIQVVRLARPEALFEIDAVAFLPAK